MDEIDSGVTATEPLTGRMVASIKKALAAAEHIQYTDEADIALAFELATVVDDARESGDEERIHRASCVAMPSLHKVLTSLGLNPEGRQKLGLDTEDEEEDW